MKKNKSSVYSSSSTKKAGKTTDNKKWLFRLPEYKGFMQAYQRLIINRSVNCQVSPFTFNK